MAGVAGRGRGRGGSAPPTPNPGPRADSGVVPSAQGAHVPGSQGPTAQAPTHQNQGQRQGYQGQRPRNGNQNNYRQQPLRQNYQVNCRQSKETQRQANIHNIPASPAIPATPTTVGMSSVAPNPVATPEQELDPRYNKLICFNCGDPGHFVGNCVKPKLCFICNLPGHRVYSCPEWNKDHPVANYFGSANSGLGFYHIDVPDAKETQWLNFRNCGVVVVKKGVTNLSNLERLYSVASILGILMDIDWPTLFKSFYVSVRMKVAVRDVSKVPVGRVVEMEHKLYLFSFFYEHPTGSSSGDGVEEYGSAQEEEGECLSPTVCDQLSTVKKDLLPFLDQATGQNFSLALEKPKKSGWGPVIAPRMSTRNHGNQNIIEKAKEYQKRKNLEVPSRLKGNSFVVLDNCILGNMASSVRINIGVDEVDRDNIIDNIVSAEIDRNRVFVNNNPELVLPHDDIFHDQSPDLNTDFPPLPCACDHRLPNGSQPYNMGVWKTVVSKSSSRKKHNKRHDRCNMEH
ncbi:hypothetical protein ACQ4PT_031192 [Festuca glaucescens]